jgi:hypothetical protein
MKLQFKSHSIEKNIDWTWTEMDKAYWDTWIPKKSDLKILTKLDKEQKKLVLDELWEDLQISIQFIRDRNNARRRAKRLAQKQKV